MNAIDRVNADCAETIRLLGLAKAATDRAKELLNVRPSPLKPPAIYDWETDDWANPYGMPRP